MITMKMKSGREISFNLKTFEREQSLRDAWYAMNSIESKADTKLKITTTSGAKFLVKIGDISLVEFTAAEHVKVNPEDVHTI